MTDQSPSPPPQLSEPVREHGCDRRRIVALGGYGCYTVRVAYGNGYVFRASFGAPSGHWLNRVLDYDKRARAIGAGALRQQAVWSEAIAAFPNRTWYRLIGNHDTEGEAVLALLDVTARLDQPRK